MSLLICLLARSPAWRYPRIVRQRSEQMLFFAGIFAIFGCVALAAVGWLQSDVPPPPAPPRLPGPTPVTQVRFVRLVGNVEVREPGPASTWQPAATATAVRSAAQVRTGPQGEADLAFGPNVRVEVRPGSRVQLAKSEGNALRLVLGEGVLSADVREGSGQLVQVGAEGSDAVVATRGGRVHVQNDGHGELRAAVSTGTAALTAFGQVVELASGQESVVRPGTAPSAPTAIPRSLLLKVNWPVAGATAKRRQLVTGEANPGARLRVGETLVTADARGHFAAVVELGEGKNVLSVDAIDLLGRRAAATSAPLILDTHAPTPSIHTDPNLWRQ